MSTEKSKISSDIYDLTEFANELKATHIPLSNEETLYASTFGYLGEMAANLLQNTIITASEYSNESIPTRAKFDRNVIIHAMTLGIDKVNAVPATMKVLILIPEKKLISNLGNKKTNDRRDNQFVLDRGIGFSFEGIEYHLDYDIIITRIINHELGSKVIYTARYDMTYPNPISNIKDEILPSVLVINNASDEGDNLIAIQTELRQVMYNEKEEIVAAENDILNKTFNFSFTNQMAYFDVAIYEGNASEVTKVLTPIYDGLYKDNVTDYCYYSYVDSQNIRIRFDKNVYAPTINTKIVVRIYTTLGSEANFNYDIDNKFILPAESSTTEYSSIYVVVHQTGDGSTGGVNRSTTKELQTIIPREMLSRGFITTLTDLRNYFNSFKTEDSIIYVFRKEDGFLSRRYYAYILFKDEEDNIIPTNSIDIDVGTNTVATSGYRYIESGTKLLMAPGNPAKMVENFTDLTAEPAASDKYIFIKFSGSDRLFVAKCISATSENIRVQSILYGEDLAEAKRIQAADPTTMVVDYLTRNVPIPRSKALFYHCPQFVYTTPYTIEIRDEKPGSPATMVVYYLDTISETKQLSGEYVNPNSDIQFIVRNLKVKRNPYTSADRDNYFMTAELIPNIGDISKISKENIQAVAVYRNPDGSAIGYSIGIIDKRADTFGVTFRCNNVALSDTEHTIPHRYTESKINIDNTYPPASAGTTPEQIKKLVNYYPENMDVEIYILYRYKEYDVSDTIGSIYISNPKDENASVLATICPEFAFPEWAKPAEKVRCASYNDTSGTHVINDPENTWWNIDWDEEVARLKEDDKYPIKDMVLTNRYKVVNGVNLFYNYADKIESNVATSGSKCTILRVPVVKYMYMNSDERITRFINQVRKNMNYIDGARPKLETLFNIDCKYFNTYGPSTMYYTMDGITGGLSAPIPSVNLGLEFRTELYNDSDRSIIDQIKDDIKLYIENIDEMGEIHIPNLITQITKKYGEYFVYFEFRGFDYDGDGDEIAPGTDRCAGQQHIVTNEDLEVLTKVPEFLNVMVDDITGTPKINISVIN